MSDVQTHEPMTSLGIGKILGDSVNIFAKRFILFIVLSLIIGLGLNALNYAVFGAALFINPEELFLSGGAIAAFVSTIVVSMLASTLLTAIITYAAYDAHQEQPVRVGLYISNALKNLLPIIILSFVTAIAFGLGFALFIVPGLWLLAVWSVVIPTIVVDKAGFSALGRSAQLTKGYRWPIVGLLVISFIVIGILNFLIALVAGFGGALMFGGAIGGLGAFLFQGALSAVGYALYAIVVVVLFARLKDIKEGVGMDDLIEVFS